MLLSKADKFTSRMLLSKADKFTSRMLLSKADKFTKVNCLHTIHDYQQYVDLFRVSAYRVVVV